MGDGLRLARGVVIPLAELEWRFSGSGGPGGQHANTANTRVEVVFDIAASPSLDEITRARLVAKLGDEVRVVASDQRSQWQNRRLATERLQAKLTAALVVPRRRVATKPTLGSKKRRLDAKSRTSGLKETRRPPSSDD